MEINIIEKKKENEKVITRSSLYSATVADSKVNKKNLLPLRTRQTLAFVFDHWLKESHFIGYPRASKILA